MTPFHSPIINTTARYLPLDPNPYPDGTVGNIIHFPDLSDAGADLDNILNRVDELRLSADDDGCSEGDLMSAIRSVITSYVRLRRAPGSIVASSMNLGQIYVIDGTSMEETRAQCAVKGWLREARAMSTASTISVEDRGGSQVGSRVGLGSGDGLDTGVSPSEGELPRYSSPNPRPHKTIFILTLSYYRLKLSPLQSPPGRRIQGGRKRASAFPTSWPSLPSV